MPDFKPKASPHFHGSNPGGLPVGHETKDVNVKAILAFLVTLVITGGLVFGICLGIYNAFNKYVAKHDGEPSTWTANQVEKQTQTMAHLRKDGATTNQIEQSVYEAHVESFPQPRLQTDDTRDMQMLRDQEDLQLDNYMWIDQSAGKVVIPIDRAIELTAERGIPAIPAAKPPAIREPLSLGVTRVARTSSHDPKR
ncbi:MAG: hypothetical protein ABI383_08400 [Acidobacteriaceae bacterium]